MERFTGKIALVTGGTSGIGLAIARQLAREGAEVICVGRDSSRGENAVAEHEHMRFLQADVSRSADVQELFKKVKDKYGCLDILVNSAGILVTRSLDELTEDDFEKVFSINLKGTMELSAKMMPMLVESRGSVLNISSAAGLDGHNEGRRAYLYASSKAALIKFTKLCALNYAPEVRVNCLAPGIIDTPIYINRDYSRFQGIPMGRVGTAEETARAAAFLLSEEASYITGVVLPVDGGSSLR